LIVAAAIAFLASTLNLELQTGSGDRKISIDEIKDRAVSVFSNDNKSLSGTKEWRLEWWQEIVGYTVEGPYFWQGKGFGINLANADGFQVLEDESLRAPHNSHLTVLARMGVPGFSLWIVLQGAFALALLRALLRARRDRQMFWAQIDAWLLFYWLAMIINANFDPYLEGPQGGIWFWSIFGAGLAALATQRENNRMESSQDAGVQA
jgi:O-antigen ligase